MNQNEDKYRVIAEYYDILDKDPRLAESNALLHRILSDYQVTRVLDVTCGTGHQVEFLHELGYQVTGIDICEQMLAIARRRNPAIDYRLGDMRCTQCGQFDAAISSGNSIGLLSRDDFARALINVHAQLTAGGLFVFAIMNPEPIRQLVASKASELGSEATINAHQESQQPGGTVCLPHEVIDRAVEADGKKYVRFSRPGFDSRELVVTFHDRIIVQQGALDPPVEVRDHWTLQLYTADAMNSLLASSGFRAERLTDRLGQPFKESTSSSMLIVARKHTLERN